MHDNEEKVLNKMKESLDFLDTAVESKKPDFLKFVELVNEVEERKEYRKNRQFLIFLAIAIAVITFEIYSFSRSIMFFAVFQAAALAFIVPAVIVYIYRNNRKVTG